MKKISIAVAQLNVIVGDIEENTQRILQTTASLSNKADIVIFPELALCGYPPEDLLLRQELHDRCDQAIKTLLENVNDTAILLGHPQKTDDSIQNTASLIHHHEITAQYAKQQLPNHTVFDEKRYFSPGHKTTVIEFKSLRIGLLICEDLWQPEPMQAAKQAGADLIICINASPFARDKQQMRIDIARQRCQENQLPLIYANLVGGQDELVFDGGSMALNAKGQLCLEAAYFEEDNLMIEVDIMQTGCALRHPPLPAPPTTTTLDSIYRALVLGVKDYINKNHFPGVIIGLSGGIDSALTLAIAYDALGPSNISVISMPSRYTAEMSNTDAKKMAVTVGVDYRSISIEPLFDSYLEVFDEQFSAYKQGTARENIQARIRGNLLMALSNMSGQIILTTGNKSELSVGYCTLYGDMAGGFAVLKDIPKTLVYELCHYRNGIAAIIPDNIIQRPPSAELRDNQLDEDSLPAYDILDQIIELYVNQDLDINAICETGIHHQDAEKIIHLINKNEYKRRQAPIGIRISQRAYGKDRRYPITSSF